MRLAVLALTALLASAAAAQTPDIAVYAEARPSAWFDDRGRSEFNWFTRDCEYSLVGIRLLLETGNRVLVSQRLQRVENSGDPDSVDEAYIENRAFWRIGKQYLPFGLRHLLRESALAARVDAFVPSTDIPLQIAVCDAGPGRNRALYARIGRKFGVSFATGRHIAIQPSAMTPFNHPEDAPGAQRGHKFAIGADASYDLRVAYLEAEWVALRRPELDPDTEQDYSILRLRMNLRAHPGSLNLSWARAWGEGRDVMVAEADLPVNETLTWRPFVRLEGTTWHEAGVVGVMRF